MGHGLALITVDERAAGAKWSCTCGACGFCWPDGWAADDDLRAAALYAVAQDGHRRHVAAAIITEAGGWECDAFTPRRHYYCGTHRWVC